jgi:predicted unusual protein kinase regulating ubiquinone biosynthesis (AarF/ABC1/UbiB family)
MSSRWLRTLTIFRLAFSYWGDSRRIARAHRTLSQAEARRREEAILRAGAIRFRETALKLGGLIIKVGQFLSARTDLLPLAFTRELAQLQDQVPEAPWDQVQQLMADEWGQSIREIFGDIDPHPVAAASLGQVHRATLRTGTDVAIKVQRPGIDRLAQIDLAALSVIMRVLERLTRVGRRINATRLFQEFESLVEHELDYRQEAEYLVRFRRNFAEVADVMVPDVVPEFTRRRVFVMEFVWGTKLTEIAELRAQDLDPVALANILIRAYLKQIAVDGFVQIDPHAGNFFASPDGRVIFLDFGMMAELPRQDLNAIVTLVQGILSQDVDSVVAAIDDLGFVRPTASPRLLKRAVAFMLDRLSGVPLNPGPEMDRAVAEFQDFLYHEPLEFPARYMFLGRAIGMLFGLVSQLHPNIDWMAVVQKEMLPLLKDRQRDQSPQWIGQLATLVGHLLGDSAAAVVTTTAAMGWREVTNAVKVPGQLHRVLAIMEQGNLATEPEMTGIMRRLDRIAALNQAQLRLIWALALGAAAWSVHRLWSGQIWLMWIAGLASVWMGLAALVAGRRGARRLRRRSEEM